MHLQSVSKFNFKNIIVLLQWHLQCLTLSQWCMTVSCEVCHFSEAVISYQQKNEGPCCKISRERVPDLLKALFPHEKHLQQEQVSRHMTKRREKMIATCYTARRIRISKHFPQHPHSCSYPYSSWKGWRRVYRKDLWLQGHLLTKLFLKKQKKKQKQNTIFTQIQGKDSCPLPFIQHGTKSPHLRFKNELQGRGVKGREVAALRG